MAQPTVMIVDDTAANLRLMEQILRDAGYRVLAFPRGDLALSAARKHRPDLILLDILMPGLDGFQVCERLKADPALKDAPVLFMSALQCTEDKVRGFHVGAVDYVIKPIQVEELLARVETHLKLHRLQIELERRNMDLEATVREKMAEISESQMATIFALARLAGRRDDDTGWHIERTRTFCRVLAGKLQKHPRRADKIDDAFVDTLSLAAPLHDMGKVGISDAILLKPGKLTPDEFEVMKTHTIIGAETLEHVCRRYPQNVFVSMGATIARSHHEKWDGSGYPDGLAGEAIPLCARIMALADVYDALCSERPYKPAFSHEKARAIIMEGAGRHFDPEVVAAFAEVEAAFAGIRARMDDPAHPSFCLRDPRRGPAHRRINAG